MKKMLNLILCFGLISYSINKITATSKIGCKEFKDGKCEECEDGFHEIDDVCVLNTEHCEKYNKKSDKCKECEKGYGLNENGVCTSCGIGCKECTGKNNQIICKECFDYYYLNNNKCSLPSIDKIIPGCEEYSHSQSMKCEECEKGYVLSEDETQCIKCGTGCRKCKKNGNVYECVRCMPNYSFDDDGACKKCDTGCEVCDPTKGKCASCEKGYFLNDDGKCSPCESGCKKCVKKFCKECKPFYALMPDGSCGSCGDDCPFCYFDTSGKKFCGNSEDLYIYNQYDGICRYLKNK